MTGDGGWRRRAPRYYYESRSRYFAKFYGRPASGWPTSSGTLDASSPCLPRDSWVERVPPGTTRAADIWTNAASPTCGRGHGHCAPAAANPPPSHDAPLPSGDTNLIPGTSVSLPLLAEDYRTHDRKLLEPGFVAIALHRFGNARMSVRSEPPPGTP